MAGPGAPKTGGRQPGTPNKITADVRVMILAALDHVGGEEYLVEQATANPRAFMSLLGRLIPTQVTAKDDAPLIPDTSATDARIVALLVKAGLSESEARAALDADAG